MAAFVWGKNGEKLTPEDVARQRLASQNYLKEASSFAPVGHWTQALGRAFDGWASGRLNKIAGQGEEAGLASADEAIAALLAGRGGAGYAAPSFTASSSGAPAPAAAQQGPEYPIGVDALPQSPTTPGGYSLGTEMAPPVDPTLELIKGFEGFRETPYWDVNALRTGYGSDTITTADGRVVPVTEGARVSREDADRDLQRRAQTEFAPIAARAVGEDIFTTLDPNQRAALTSIAYNYGELPSSVAAAVRSGDPQAAASAIAALGSHNGGVNAGRRSKEAAVYLGADVPQGGAVTMSTSGTSGGYGGGGGGGVDIASLLALQKNPWVAQKYGGVVDALMGQQFARENAMWEQQQKMADPMYQAQLAELTAPKVSEYDQRAAAAVQYGFQPGTPEYQRFVLGGDIATPGGAEGFTLSPGQVRYDAAGNEVAAVDAPPPDPTVPTTKNVTLSDGSEVMVQWNPANQVWDAAPIPSGGTSGTGQPTKLTEGQSKLKLFQTLQTETAPVLLELEKQFDPANFTDPAAASIPIAGNYFASPEYQQYKVAASAWAEGALRISTGAAATPEEIERNLRTYFAQPGDTPSTVAFKAKMRDMYDRAVLAAQGQPDSGERLSLPTPAEFAEQVISGEAAAATGAGGSKTKAGVTWSVAP